MSAHAHWSLRVPFAAVFLYHGLGKAAAPAMTADMMEMPLFVILLVTTAEILAGLGALAGGIPGFSYRDVVTRLAGLAAAPVMLGAIAMVHWPRWSFTPSETHPMGGMEFQVTVIGIAVYFMLAGAGGRGASGTATG